MEVLDFWYRRIPIISVRKLIKIRYNSRSEFGIVLTVNYNEKLPENRNLSKILDNHKDSCYIINIIIYI